MVHHFQLYAHARWLPTYVSPLTGSPLERPRHTIVSDKLPVSGFTFHWLGPIAASSRRGYNDSAMKRPGSELLIAVAVGLISDLWPIPGAILAALFFREGVHSSSPMGYMSLTLIFNFVLLSSLTHVALRKFSDRGRRTVQADQRVSFTKGPVKGLIYTESEIEEFRKHGF